METLQVRTAPSKDASSKGLPRLEFLDALRGIGALMVVVQHVGDAYFTWMRWFTQNWFNFGKFGVTVFFLVSGFVIPYAFEKDSSKQSFWIKRVFRLYPVYWLSLALTLIASDIYPEGFQGPHLLRNILVNATMLQGFFGLPNALDPYWTLFIEMAFYLTFTAFFLTHLHRKTLVWAWTGLGGFVCAGVVLPLFRGAHGPVNLAFCFLTMLVGSVFYRFFTGFVTGLELRLLLLAVCLVAGIGSYINCTKFTPYDHVSGLPVFLSWVAAFAVFSFGFVERSWHFPKRLLWLGRISYSLYLLHAVTLNALPTIANPVVGSFTVIVLSIVVSALSYRYIERPFISLGHRIAAR